MRPWVCVVAQRSPGHGCATRCSRRSSRRHGSRPRPRPPCAATGTKYPDYPDATYVDELVVADVPNTMPRKTLEAVEDHSPATGADTVHGTYEQSKKVLDDVVRVGVPYDKLLAELESEGVSKFEKSWDELLQTRSEERRVGKEG